MESNVEDILRELGLEWGYSGQKWLLMRCPLHDDSKPSFLVSKVDGGWRCESEGIFGSLPQLVARIRGWKVADAVRWISRFNRVQSVDSDDLLKQLVGKKDEPFVGENEPFDTNRFPKFMRERGFDPKIMKHFGVGYDATRGAAVLPMESHRIYRYAPGAELRYLYSQGYPKSLRLFREDLWRGPDAVLVEGSLDCMWLHQFGWQSGLAILGRNVSATQATWLFKNASVVTLFFDNDEAGLDATRQAILQLRNEVRVARPPTHRKDPQECTGEELDEAIGNAVAALDWLIAT